MAYAGVPGVMFGRTERVAWGCTNNICSQRDLYLEKTDPAHPGWDLVTGRYSDQEWYASYLAQFGPDVVVLGPPELREAVIRQLKGALA